MTGLHYYSSKMKWKEIFTITKFIVEVLSVIRLCSIYIRSFFGLCDHTLKSGELFIGQKTQTCL